MYDEKNISLQGTVYIDDESESMSFSWKNVQYDGFLSGLGGLASELRFTPLIRY